MNITELLITGFDGERAVFAVNLSPDMARAIFTESDDDGQVTVDATAQYASGLFGPLAKLFDGMTIVSP
ncbi:hypothetical protein Rhe02_47230 [Rhizocola hellebori]|uniref:Uncharacterized protein n=1 Tax=Rhizocola hellebori TaxID=1392758 RepID=A0A8J3VI48_9ACTN|nr:hypothetical protein [Rhizocola hellebori]GIH06656.1 hypothetical protein Rhe02_47230 [Rhizocola hellebori]